MLSTKRRQLASVSASRPLEADHLAAAAAGQRDLANDVDRRGVFLVLGRFAQHLAERSILRFREAAIADIVLRLTDAVGWIVLDDAGFDSIGENAAEQTYGSCCRAGAAADDWLCRAASWS